MKTALKAVLWAVLLAGCSGSTGSMTHDVCGDGVRAPSEACDDHNTVGGDGCSSTCTVESGFACAGSPSTCHPVCGDKLLAGGEVCDDGNTADGDGCGAACTLEAGYACTGTPSACAPVCGDGMLLGGEGCDDGNTTAGDGCSAACASEVGYACAGAPSVCAPVCGDGALLGGEGCDDGNVNAGDGCSASCKLETGYACAGAPSVCAPVCGDGQVIAPETCDDGNTTASDGCSPTCAKETGYVCSGAPSVCKTVCGDNLKAGAEQCDDGNLVGLDGCSASCRVDVFDEVEVNDTRPAANGPYTPDVMLKAKIQPSTDVDWFAILVPAVADLSLETFDASAAGTCLNIDTVVTLYKPDGTTVLASDDDTGLDRCSKLSSRTNAALSRLPAGTYYVAVSAYAGYRTIPGYRLVVRFNALCGNGVREDTEQCDGTAGCTAACARTVTCGDGFVDGAESCDDGNVAAGDGCDATCGWEVLAETEPNDSTATGSGPFAKNALLGGAISPVGDLDFFKIQLSATSDLKLETFDASGPGSCVGIDTQLTLYAPDGTTVLISRDQGGLANCAAIDPSRPLDAAARHLPAGTYFARVEDYLDDTAIPAYRLRVIRTAVCGNGVVEGAEECDGTADCNATCDRTPVCGDGLLDAPETCDDGNVTSGDGCSATCAPELTLEAEPNNTGATANGPLTPFAQVKGAISPAADVDFWKITLPQVSDLTLELFDGSGPGSCFQVDPVVTLTAADGTTVLATAHNPSATACSKLDPKGVPGLRQLPAGTYFARVEDFGNNTVISGYTLRLRATSKCGNNVVEGYEQCDGTTDCNASCQFAAVCNNTFPDLGEPCDLAGSFGCSATCTVSAVEAEPNNTTAQAGAAAVSLTQQGWVSGAIGVIGDVDLFKLTVSTREVVQIDTYDATASGCGISTTLRVLSATGVELWRDDNSGVFTCSSLVVDLLPGTYFLQVEQRGGTATIPAYLLEVRPFDLRQTDTEPNELLSTANAVPLGTTGHYTLVGSGSHQLNTDSDVFAITVPEGRSIRAEILEGGAETCESGGVDSYLTLYNAAGLALGWDDDSGRGACSRIDGTGASPDSAFASRLPAGTYYLQVEASPFAQGATNPAGQFDYQLAINVR